MEQIFARALCGDEQAIRLMISTARGAVRALENLEKRQPAKLQARAEENSDWPVLLSLNPQDIKHAEERIAQLKVGTKATIPRRPNQKLDPQNLWTQLAAAAVQECEDNKVTVSEFEKHCVGAKRKRRNRKFWGTPAAATIYSLGYSDVVIIADWEKQCVKLSAPITPSNVSQWWHVVKFWVLEYWWSSEKTYKTAIAKIFDKTAPKEFQKRNRALAQVRKAFRSLVGLRQ
jgi:hypothetical protein